MGLVLQDLTFVHIGNGDYANKDNVVNFAKRWQQYNILVIYWNISKGRKIKIYYFFA